MKLTQSEFQSIRPLVWTKQKFGTELYFTPTTIEDTKLFWHDFILNVFVKKFKSQNTITTMYNFDQTFPVRISENYDLVLPAIMEKIIYYADNQKMPLNFSIPVPMKLSLCFGVFVLVCLVVFGYIVNKSKKLSIYKRIYANNII